MCNECVTFHTVKSHFPLRPRPGVITTKDKKMYERQRSVLKATEINCFLFFSFLKIPFKHATMKVTGDKERKKKSSLNIH